MTASSIPWPRPLVILMSAILPVVSMTMSRMTSPLVPRGRTERSGFGVGKKLARSMLILPEPSESAPVSESGFGVAGELVLGEAVLVFNFGAGGGGSGVLVAASFGSVFGLGVEAWTGARPGR